MRCAARLLCIQPCKRAQRQLDEAISLKFIPPNCGWERVNDTKGNDTNLWKRTPLLTAADIAAFAKQAAGLRGVKQLRWAAEHMTGQAASPFEVQTSMLISLPRDEGGQGIEIANNARIPLSEAARSLYDKTCCYADILIESATDSMGVISGMPRPLRPRQRSRKPLRCRARHRTHKHGLRRHPNYL